VSTPEDLEMSTMALDDDEAGEVLRTSRNLLRFVFLCLALYVVGGVASSVAGVIFNDGLWPLVGLFWPLFFIIIGLGFVVLV